MEIIHVHLFGKQTEIVNRAFLFFAIFLFCFPWRFAPACIAPRNTSCDKWARLREALRAGLGVRLFCSLRGS